MLYTQIQSGGANSQQFYRHLPTDRQIDAFLHAQADQPFSYPAVGATKTGAPGGYTVDHNRIMLGSGEQIYRSACAALQSWAMFDLGWVQLCWPDAPLTIGTTVGVLAQVGGMHILNACRIVYTVNEESGDEWRFGFAYGTLPGHIERGEERFLIGWDRRTDTVWYDILAFSQPAHWLVRLGNPVARTFQKRFARDSKLAMQRSSHAT